MLPPNQSGEICIRGLGVTKGYYRNEKATADTFDQEGWLHSGDIGYYDEDGDIFIVDRLKELIKYNAYQVSTSTQIKSTTYSVFSERMGESLAF